MAWGDDPLTEVRYQAEPGCNYGPQSFRIDAATGMISILDPLNASVKYFKDGVLEGKAGAPREARDFVIESGSTYIFLSGNQLTRGLVENSGTSGIVAGTEKYEAIKLSSNMARISVGGNAGSAYLTIDVPVTSGNLGCLRIVGVDGIGRIFVDVDLVERAVPLKVQREVWIIDRSGRTLGKIGIPTHYFTRIFRDLELDANGDLYHMISSEDGIHIMKWTVPESGGFFEGEYPSEFRRELHYNYFLTGGFSDSNDHPEMAPQGTLADTVTRAQALAKADTYVQHLWTATAANISNGVVVTPDGDSVRTPDWIVVGQNQKVPYKFGGTDELASFDSKIAAGLYAGDNHTEGSSNYATGVDCSGFICRCWRTNRDYSTYQMVDPSYGPPTLPYSTWDQIQPGDAVHREGHVRMAVSTLQDGTLMTVESAGSATGWRVDYSSYTLSELAGYSPRYYIHMEGIPATVTIETAGSGSWTTGSTWVGGVVPTGTDDVIIRSGHTVSVDNTNATCRNVSFGGNNALIDMNSNSLLTVYGDFTLFSTTHIVFSAGWSATNARIKFAGSAVQTLRGWSTTGGCTSFRDVIIDKTGSKIVTDGSNMRLGIQNSLEIVNGLFELAAQDDIEGRFASSGGFTNTALPNITIRAGGELYLADGDGAHHIRAGTGVAIGTVTVYGKATFRDASNLLIILSGVNIESGGKVLTSTEMGGGEFSCGPLVIKSGGEVENYTTSDCWSATSSVTIQSGGMFDTKASTTIFPTIFTNNGTVRYSRDETTDQTIVDMNYNRLEISLDPDNNKNWTLGANRVIADSLKINYDGHLVLTASVARTLTVGNMLHLSSGTIDNSDPDVSLVISDGALIKRVTGSLAAAPVFAGTVDLIYASTSTNVTTGPEMPVGTGVLSDLTLTGDEGMTLGANVTVNGTCAATGSDILTGAHTLTLGPTAVLTESGGKTVVGTVRTTRTAAQSVNQTFGGIGIEINAAGGAPGVTTATRVTGTPLSVNGTEGIGRYFDLSPANNSGLDATVVLHYDESELNGITESVLKIYATPDGGGTWSSHGGTVNETANTVTGSSVSSLATLTLGPDNLVTGVDDDLEGIPSVTRIASIYPNPFNPTTKIVFDLNEKTPVQIAVFDASGRLVCTLQNGVLEAGRHDVTWRGVSDSGNRVSSGVYFCRMRANRADQTMKLVLLR